MCSEKLLTMIPPQEFFQARPDSETPSPMPLLLTARQAAAICGKSARTWGSWDAAARIPQPVRIGRSTLWRADELRAWVAAGCPRREEWEMRVL